MFFVNEATFLKSLFKHILNFTYKETLLVSASLKNQLWGFPGGSVVKNPPANAGDVGLVPAQGRCTSRAATRPLHHSCRACAQEPRARLQAKPSEEKPTHRAWRAASTATREQPAQQWRPSTAENKVFETKKQLWFLKLSFGTFLKGNHLGNEASVKLQHTVKDFVFCSAQLWINISDTLFETCSCFHIFRYVKIIPALLQNSLLPSLQCDVAEPLPGGRVFWANCGAPRDAERGEGTTRDPWETPSGASFALVQAMGAERAPWSLGFPLILLGPCLLRCETEILLQTFFL